MSKMSQSREFNTLSDEEFKEKVRTMTFSTIADHYRISTNTVSFRARKLGIAPTFSRRAINPLTEIDRARIVMMRDKMGMSFNAIGELLHRSYAHVNEIYNRMKKKEEEPEEEDLKLPWPARDSDMYRGMNGRLYDNVPQAILDREWPPHYKPVDGRAYIRKMYERSTTGCSSVLCMEN